MKFKVQKEIFEKFPDIRIGVLVVLGMDNTLGEKEISGFLAQEEEKKRKELISTDIKELPKVAVWRQIYFEFGSKPVDFRSSVEALLRRVQAGNKLPNINPLVDLYNYISIKHMVPAGAEDLDKVKGDIVLGFAKGIENGKYIGPEEISTCDKGEVAYFDDLGFICRKWNWREGDRTKIMPETENAVVVLEANQNVSDKDFQVAIEETEKLIKKYLKAKIQTKILDAEILDFDIDFESGQKLTKKDLKIPSLILGYQTREAVAKSEIKKEQKQKYIDKGGPSFKLSKIIFKAVVGLLGRRKIKFEDIVFEHPENPEHGDWATNVAMKVFSRFKMPGANLPARLAAKRAGKAGPGHLESVQNPFDLANKIVTEIRSQGLPEYIAKIEVAPQGFINIWLCQEYFVSQVQEVLKGKNKYGQLTVLKGKKILLEHTSPNPQTTIMLGHLRNNFLGMSVANILEFCGAKVIRDCLVNDRGVHICRSILGYLVFARKNSGLGKRQLLNFKEITDKQIVNLTAKVNWKNLLLAWEKKKTTWITFKDFKLKSDHANLIWYVLGSRAYVSSDVIKSQVEEILKAWEAEETGVRKVWKQIMDWSSKGYSLTYQRVRSIHDWVWYESDHWKEGKSFAEKGLKMGVFVMSQGAMVSNLAKYGLPDLVIVKSDGTALYPTQDLALTKKKIKKFPSDLYIWDLGMEHRLYFQQMSVIYEQLGFGKREKFFHLSYALINFKGGGKMATRKGDVVMADEILDQLHKKAVEIIKNSNQELRGKLSPKQLDELAEKVAVGAVKYSLLKFSRETTIYFDSDESLSLEGDSGPYLQYTYARTQSVIHKAKNQRSAFSVQRLVNKELDASRYTLNAEELMLLRTVYKFPEIVKEAAENYAPNLICNFLFDLAQKYNNFYNKHRILGGNDKETENFRLALTQATGQVLKNGLGFLGIETPQRM